MDPPTPVIAGVGICMSERSRMVGRRNRACNQVDVPPAFPLQLNGKPSRVTRSIQRRRHPPLRSTVSSACRVRRAPR